MTKNIFGLLWFDNNPKKDWRQKVKDAAARYKEKRWLVANLCHVSPQTIGVEVGLQEQKFIEVIDGIEVYATINTLPDNYWVTHRPTTQDQTTKPPTPQTAAQQLTLL